MKVYRYWCEPATADDARMLKQQLSRAARYRRELVRIENLARALQRSIIQYPDDERKSWRKIVLNAQRSANKVARDQARKTTPEDGIGCAWGTCGQVDDSFDQAQRTTKIWSDVSTFAAYDEGLLAVQYQRHEGTANWMPTIASGLVGGDDTFVQIGADLIGKNTKRSREIAVASGQDPDAARGAKKLRALRFRVGSVGRTPIWANLYTLMHRPLPDARVTWVKLSCRRVGLRYRWFLLVVVDEECRGNPDQHRVASVGVDIGWRKKEDGGIRVAYWHGSDGQEGELVVPERVHRRKGKSDSLRAIRDRERNEVSAQLRAWIFGTITGSSMEPDEEGLVRAQISAEPIQSSDDVGDRSGLPATHPVRVSAQAMHSWTRIGRFVVLARLWDANRVPGDEAIHARVKEWLKHDRHLYAWEANNRRRMALQITGLIDDLAVKLARRYDLVAVEKRGMVPDLVRKDDANDQAEERLRALNATRVGLVAPASMRMALERFAKKYGAIYREVEPAYTTRVCSMCGSERAIDDPAELMLSCDRCGLIEDQDRTAARNIALCASAQVESERAEALAPANSRGKARKLGPRRNRKSPQVGSLETGVASTTAE